MFRYGGHLSKRVFHARGKSLHFTDGGAEIEQREKKRCQESTESNPDQKK